MALKPVESYPAGGVDSRSNPIVEPADRCLMVHDLWPQQDGSYRLRDGYVLQVAGLQANVAIHSIVSLTGPAPGLLPLVVFWQNKTPYILNQSTNTVSTPTIKGAGIASNARFSYFYANGHLHAFNGTDAKWFDGTYWRDIGLPTLSSAQVAAISVAVDGGVGLTPAQAAAITLTFGSGGNWPQNDVTGEYVYASILSQTGSGLPISSPWVQLGSGYREMGLTGQKLAIAGTPTLPAGSFLIFGITSDGGSTPLLCALTGSGSAATPLPGPGSTTWSANLAVVDSTAHGISSSAVIAGTWVNGLVSGSFGPVVATVVDANHFSFADTTSLLNGATVTAYLVVTGTAISNYQWTVPSFSVPIPGASNLAASTIGGDQPGYQFYASIYNPTTGHVGNRAAIGSRLAPQGPCTPILSGLPTLSDAEWVLLIGRTSDGAEIPYAIVDGSGNWVTTTSTSSFVIPFGQIDGNSELPSRNYPPPGTLDCNYQYSLLPGGAAQNPPITGTFQIAWLESDHCCGVLNGSPTIYRSGSALDMREGVFVGLPEQSWDPADIETFPTNNPVLAGHGYQQESWCFTTEDCGILMEIAGETSWQGPYNVGIAGQHAWARGWQNLPFWITGEKQLATVSLGGYQQLAGLMNQAAAGPLLISNEYEAALLAQIGDAYLSQTEVVYIRKPTEFIEVLRIKCFDVNGNPFTIIHDFNLRDDRSPYGQAYQENFVGPLASAFTEATIRDQNRKPQVLCGAANGNLYLLYSGGNDAGTEFTAQALKLLDLGPQRTAVKFLEWYGDRNAQWYITRKLNQAFNPAQMDNLCQESPQEVQGQEGDSRWSVALPKPEMVHAYLLLQLTSHSADGTTALNSPPHMPVETYGRIWLVSPQLGASRPR